MKIFANRWPRSLTLEIPDEDFYRERSKETGKMGGALLPTKNSMYEIVYRKDFTKKMKVTPHNVLTDRHQHFRKLIAWHCNRFDTYFGPVRLDIEQVCRRTLKIEGKPFPQPDSDACVMAVRDALQRHPGFGGLVKDDCQIVEQSIYSSISTASPRLCSLRIEITSMPQWGKS